MTVLWIVPAALALVAVTAELLARWWIRHVGGYHVFPPGLRLLLYLDREVLPELEPLVRFEVNSDGERGSQVPRPKAGETLYRILVTGGSQPEGFLLDQETSWPGALQQLLRAPEHLEALGATHVHVGNIARSGVGSEALDRVLAHVLPRYPRLQAIVIVVGASDVLRWLEQDAPPTAPAPAATRDIFRWHPEGPFGWRVGNSAAVDLLLRMRRRWLRPLEVHQRTGAWIGRARAMRTRARVVRTRTPDPTPMLEHFQIHLRKVIQRARARADRVLVVRQSWFGKDSYTAEEAAHLWHGGVGQAWREEVTTYYSFDVTCKLMAELDRVAARVASELDVEQLELMPILDRSLHTYYDFFHLTPAGAATAAGAVAAILLRQSVVCREAVPRAQASGLRA